MAVRCAVGPRTDPFDQLRRRSTPVLGAQSETDHDLFVLAYTPDGELRWTDTWNGEGMGGNLYSWDYSDGITIDDAGILITTGHTTTATTDLDVIVRAIAP